jgi:sulfate/thiosulfate transport system permease protein
MSRFGRRYGLRVAVLVYFGLLVIVPVGLIVYRAFSSGFIAGWHALVNPGGAGTSNFTHALVLTLVVMAIAVPMNAAFGVVSAIVLARHPFRGSWLFDAAIDLPVAISPVVVGLALVLAYDANTGWIGHWLAKHGIQVIFSIPGIVMASAFVAIPYVARSVLPVLQEVGTEQEQAAATLGAGPWRAFWRITMPSIRWGLAYGVTLTAARILGEFGAVSVVSGNISGRTQTMTLYISGLFENFNTVGADMGAVLLALMTFVVLGVLSIVGSEKGAPSWRSRFAGSRRDSEASLLSTTST